MLGAKPWHIRAAMLLLVSIPVEILAQLPTATILGVVKDSSGAVVPGVQLTARNVETGQSRTAVSGQNGSYRFSALPVGSYEVRAEQTGFRAEVRRGLTLTVAQEAVVDLTLEVGSMEQTVSVTAEAPLVNTTSGALGGLVDEQRVADLPLNGRNYIDLSLLQPGITPHRNLAVSTGSIGTRFSSNGAPVRSNYYLLDGAPLANIHDATSASVAGTTLGLDGVREFRLLTNSYSAEYGVTMGSQMIVVSKGGTNTFHGSLFEYLRNSALDARNFFDYKTPTNPRRLPAFVRNNLGGSFGGPIKRDKTFFFGVYEGLRERLGKTIVTDVIPASAKIDGGLVPQVASVIKPLLTLYPDANLPNDQYTFPSGQPTREDYVQVRADHTFSASDMIFGRYTVDDADQTKPLDFPAFKQIFGSRGQFSTLSETHVFSPTSLTTFRFSYSRSRLSTDSPSGISGPQFSFVPGQEVGTIDISGFRSNGPTSTTPDLRKLHVFTWSDDVFYARGRHSLKFGALINKEKRYMSKCTNCRGSVNFASLRDFLEARPISFNLAIPSERVYYYTTWGFYSQDDVRVRSNLTLNVGLRYEFSTVPHDARGRDSALRDILHDADFTVGPIFKNPSLRNFSPRFGFAWDLQGNGQTAVRGGFGLFYDIGVWSSALGSMIGAQPPFSATSRVDNPSVLTLPLVVPPAQVGRNPTVIDYNMQQPHLLQYNLTVERQLPFSTALTVAYVGTRGINLWQIKEGNLRIPEVLADGRKFWPGATDPEGRPVVPPAPPAPRLNPAWNSFALNTTGSNSWYNSLQLGLLKRLSKGLQFQSSYTWSKVIDETQGQIPNDSSSTETSYGAYPFDRKVDRAPAGFDMNHNWQLNAIYRWPQVTSREGIGKLVNGWWSSGILSLQSGPPLTPGLGSNRSRSGMSPPGAANGADRPDLLPSRSNDNIILGGPIRYFDPGAFTIPEAGFLGTAGRNILRAPGLANLDFSLGKDTGLGFLGESVKLEFRAEFFNILNRANFAPPNRIVFAARANVEAPLSTAGRITSTASSRQIQFALKMLW